MTAVRVLVAEDDPAIREIIVHHFGREGFDVVEAADGPTALRAARDGCDCIVLDVGLPVIDGFEIARTLRHEERRVPIIFLSARVEEIDRIIGLELGADDYVTKPFSPRELVARVRAQSRRSGTPLEVRGRTRRFGRLVVDEAAREARIDDRVIPMKPREFALLHVLATNAGAVLPRDVLLRKVWGFDFEGDDRTIDVHVRRVRLKIERAGNLGYCVQTVRGFGYKFVSPRD